MYNLAMTSLLVVLLFAVYHNNRDIRKLSVSAKSANQVLEKSEVNDTYFFKSNNDIMNYLKSRDGMKKDLDLLKLDVKKNQAVNIAQDKRLEKSDMADKEHDRLIQEIKATYRSDINYLVTLSLTDAQKHFPDKDDQENLKTFRELLYVYVLEFFKKYESMFPGMKLDDFLEEYSTDVSYILAEVIYEFKVYNNSDNFPTLLLTSKQLQKELKDDAKLSFIMKTYFPRMISYIKNNQKQLFEEFEKINSSGHSTKKLFSSNVEGEFAKHVFKDSGIKTDSIDRQVINYLIVHIPEYLTRSFYFGTTNNQYVKELEKEIIFEPLYSCRGLGKFYDSWKTFNNVKKEGINMIPDTEKRKLLRDLVTNNSIFKKIYEERLKRYNEELKSHPTCKLPTLPATYRKFYDESELVFPDEKQ